MESKEGKLAPVKMSSASFFRQTRSLNVMNVPNLHIVYSFDRYRLHFSKLVILISTMIDIMYVNKQTRLLISLLPFALWSEANRMAKKSLKIKGMNSEFENQHVRPAGWTLTKRSENLKKLVILNNLKTEIWRFRSN